MGACSDETLVGHARQVLADPAPWKADALETACRALADELGWKTGDLFMPIRGAVTCRKVSTPLFETMEILGKEECTARGRWQTFCFFRDPVAAIPRDGF